MSCAYCTGASNDYRPCEYVDDCEVEIIYATCSWDDVENYIPGPMADCSKCIRDVEGTHKMNFKQEIIKKAELIGKTIQKGSDVEIRAQKDGSVKVIEVKKRTVE